MKIQWGSPNELVFFFQFGLALEQRQGDYSKSGGAPSTANNI
jgi:hypothetical protein